MMWAKSKIERRKMMKREWEDGLKGGWKDERDMEIEGRSNKRKDCSGMTLRKKMKKNLRSSAIEQKAGGLSIIVFQL